MTKKSDNISWIILQRLDLARQRNDKAAQLRAYLNLGNANVFLNDIDRAFEYYRLGKLPIIFDYE